MGLIVDTNVFISYERQGEPVSFAAWNPSDEVFISAVTISELLMGVWRADNEARRDRRAKFVEAVISSIPALSFDSAVARVHAEMGADLVRRGQPIGAHDLIIAATARFFDFSLLTNNHAEFSRVPGLRVVEFGG